MEHREAQAVTGAPALHVETPKPAEQQPAQQPAQPQEQQEVTTTTTVKPAPKDEPKQ